MTDSLDESKPHVRQPSALEQHAERLQLDLKISNAYGEYWKARAISAEALNEELLKIERRE